MEEMREVKAVKFSMGVRCGKGSEEFTFIDTTYPKTKHFQLKIDENRTLHIFNAETGKKFEVDYSNQAYREIVEKKVESSIKRASKPITQ